MGHDRESAPQYSPGEKGEDLKSPHKVSLPLDLKRPTFIGPIKVRNYRATLDFCCP
jgi:hypothetical protein